MGERNWREQTFGGNDFLNQAYAQYVRRLFETFENSRGEAYIRKLAHSARIFCSALAGEYAQV